MTSEFFLAQLQLSTTSAIEFGSRYITNPISENIRYNIEFNQSNDEHVGGSFSIYPGDCTTIHEVLKFQLDSI